MGFLTRLIVAGLGLWLASELVPGMDVQGGWTLIGAALLLGIVNAIVRPVLVVLTLPFTIQGDTSSVTSLTVVLTNAVGDSQPSTANF